jgi:mannose-6-phosphate isomerase-like protein (cupin superfamily)
LSILGYDPSNQIGWQEAAMVNVVGGGVVLRPDEALTIDLGGFGVTVLADESTTEGGFSLIETGETTAGLGPPLHIHRDCAESFYVISGSYRMHLDGQDFDCPAGSFVYVPVGMRHTFQSAGPGSRKLNLYTPAGMVGYFEELAAAIAEGVDETGLDALAERYQMEIVGPVPEGYL